MVYISFFVNETGIMYLIIAVSIVMYVFLTSSSSRAREPHRSFTPESGVQIDFSDRRTARFSKPAAFAESSKGISRCARRAAECRAAELYGTRSNHANRSHYVPRNGSVYPPQPYVYDNEAVEPDLNFAGTQDDHVARTNHMMQHPDPDNLHERHWSTIELGGDRKMVFVECVFRVTNTFKHGYSNMVVALTNVDFGIERGCSKHAHEGRCDSSCNPFFIDTVEIHGTPRNGDSEDWNSLRVRVKAAEPDAIFAINEYRQFNLTLGGTSHPWSNALGFQLGQGVTRQVAPFDVRADKDDHNAKASWIWTLRRFENGKKMKYRAVNTGRSPKLATYPTHKTLPGKDTDSSLAEATWTKRGAAFHWSFDIQVTVRITRLKSHFLRYSLRRVKTLDLVQEWRRPIPLASEPTDHHRKDSRYSEHEFGARRNAGNPYGSF